MSETRTYRGGSLEELLPRILEELGPEAVVTRQREGVVGGLGGFFGKRCVEVEVQAPTASAGGLATAPGEATPAGRDNTPLRPVLPRRAVLDAYDAGDAPLDTEPARFAPAAPAAAPSGPSAEPARAALSAASPAAFAAPAPGTGSPIIDSLFAAALPFADHLTSAAVAAARGASAATALQEPGSWADDLDLSLLDAEEFQPLDLDAGPLGATGPDEGGLPGAAGPLAGASPASTRPATSVRAPAPVPARAPVAEPAPAVGPARPACRSASEPVAVAVALAEAGLPERLALAIERDVARDVRPFAAELPVRAQARVALARRIKTRSGWRGRRRTIALVGASGAGKTLAAAKLCHAFAVGGGLSVGALSLGPPRAALRLGWLTDGIGVDLQIAELPAQVPLAAGRLDARDLVVVDTPGVAAADVEGIERLGSLLTALRPDETHFLVPATADVEPSQALLAALAPRLGVDRLLITRLDGAPALGAHVALSISAKLPVSYLAAGDAPDRGLAPADPAVLASMVLP